MSYHGFGIEFQASASTSGGASASVGPTGPTAPVGMGPVCLAGTKPNPMYMSTPTALLPKSPLSPLCLFDKSYQPPIGPAPVPGQVFAPGSLFRPRPPVTLPSLVLKSGAPVAPEQSSVGTYVLIGLAVLAVGGAGYYAYKKSKSPS